MLNDDMQEVQVVRPLQKFQNAFISRPKEIFSTNILVEEESEFKTDRISKQDSFSIKKSLFRRELSKRFPMPMSPMSLGFKRVEESVEEGNRPSSQSRNEEQRSVRTRNRRDVVDVAEEVGLNPRVGLKNVRQSIDTPLFRRALSKRFPMPMSPMSLGVKRVENQ